ncbi:MAG: proteasome subunit beta [Candidatus Diapherotrites archaeon]
MDKDLKQLKTGTTTVGIIYNNGVVLAADKRASMGHIVYEEDSEKIYDINGIFAITNAGNVGDSLMVIRFLKAQAKIYELEREEKMTAKEASNLLSNILGSSRYYPYICQFLVAGYNNGPELFDVTPFGAMLERKNYGATGSGTEQALATLDNYYKEGMNEKEAILLGIKAIEAGKRRDVFSGGKGVTVFVVDSKGVRQVPQETLTKYIKTEA